MQYMGSKNRFAKYIAPIIQSYVDRGCKGYLEPMVGGANMIDKIECDKKYGCDSNEYLIELLNHIQNTMEDIPDFISKQEYLEVKGNKNNYPIWYQGLIGFCSFGCKYWGGFMASHKGETKGTIVTGKQIGRAHV